LPGRWRWPSTWRATSTSPTETAIGFGADGSVTTLAGDGREGFLDGPGATAEFYGQEGIAVSPDGRSLYVADGSLGEVASYHRIRKIAIAP
jgi:sugar lactone lactonase YvrE